MGRKKIQITRIMDERNRQVSPWGMGGWMSMRVEERRGRGGRKEKHPTPHIALKNEGLLGVWAICELGDREVCAGIAQLLLWVEEFHWLTMASLFQLNLTNQCEDTRSMCLKVDLHKNICNSKNPFCISVPALRAAAYTQLKHPSHTQILTTCHLV